MEQEERIAKLEEKILSNSRRLDQAESGVLELRETLVRDLMTTVATIATKLENTNVQVLEIKSDIRALSSKPGKRWDTIVEVLIGAVIGAIVGFIANGIVRGAL